MIPDWENETGSIGHSLNAEVTSSLKRYSDKETKNNFEKFVDVQVCFFKIEIG